MWRLIATLQPGAERRRPDADSPAERSVFWVRPCARPSTTPCVTLRFEASWSVFPQKGLSSVVLLFACGGAPPAPEVPEPSSAEAAASVAPSEGPPSEGAAPQGPSASEDARAIPTECVEVGELCLPPRPFVKRLCQDAYTSAAFHLFEKGSPYSRGYVRARTVQAVNTLGGPSSDAPLRFDEEVVILTQSAPPGADAMQVSGMGGYEVLRWDGTCATLAGGELTRKKPPRPGHAPFEWQLLDTGLQEALLATPEVKGARSNHKKQCKGASFGRRTPECAAAEDTLQDTIVRVVRSGVALPPPERMP